MFRTILRMLSVVWIVLIATLVVAQDKGIKRISTLTAAEGQDKWALVVGINQYQDDGITDLRFAVNDAERLHQLLVDPELGMKTDLTRCHSVLISRRSSSCSCVRSSCWVSCMMMVSVRVRDSSICWWSSACWACDSVCAWRMLVCSCRKNSFSD